MGEQPQSRLGSTTGGSSPERRRHGKVWKGGPVMGAGDVVARRGFRVIAVLPFGVALLMEDLVTDGSMG
ncbi:unnamed protein product [Gadus morhua 'NCC']